MPESFSHLFRYPFAYPTTRRRFWVLTLLAFLPFVGSIFIGPVATAAVSTITMEKNESTILDAAEFFRRSLRAFLGGLITLLYLLPAFGLLAWMGFSFWHGEKITFPAVVLLLYGLLVLSALPFAALHAVTQKNAWAALELFKLVWINFKVDFFACLKVLAVSLAVFCLKLFLGLLGPLGDFLFAPLKAYSEYLFQYLLASLYVKVFSSIDS